MIEMYDNEFTSGCKVAARGFFMRGGTGMIYNNRYRETAPPSRGLSAGSGLC